MKPELTEKDKELVRLLQEDLSLVPEPYAEVAAAAGMSQAEVLAKVEAWLADGTIRRLGAMVRHQQLGYKANAMSAWDVPDERAEEVGKTLAAAREVSHCYQRPRAEGWRYNVFAMMHGASSEECEAVAGRLSRETGIESYELLFSTREFKKTSMKYFRE